MYVWVRFAAKLWPQTNFRTSVRKAVTEQFTVDPTLICTFLFVMSLLEQRTIAEAKEEVSALYFIIYHVCSRVFVCLCVCAL